MDTGHSLHEINESMEETTPGRISCAETVSHVASGRWTDPNHGIVFARQLTSSPTFVVAVHNEHYDSVRWRSIYKRGAYYEGHVHNAFVHILSQLNTNRPAQSPEAQQVVVMDVGMNIGYYSLLAARMGVVDRVVAFEINPTNVLRMCESLRLNDSFRNYSHENGNGGSSPVVDIYRRGVSNVNDQTLVVHVPSNPGQASMKTLDTTDTTTPATSAASAQYSTNGDASARTTTASAAASSSLVTTITLDTYAQQQGWLSGDEPSSTTAASSTTTTTPLIAILKIDVEGLEPQVLLGATKLMQSRLVRNVLTEFRDLNSAVSRQALQLLLQAGYRLVQDDAENQRVLAEGSSTTGGIATDLSQPRQIKVMTYAETQRHLQRLQHSPLWYDFHKTHWEKFKSWVTRTPVVDLWFTLDHKDIGTKSALGRRSAPADVAPNARTTGSEQSLLE
jgi:Methyltransferase FkbM domain